MYHICNNTESEVQFQCPKCDFVHDRRQFMKHHKQVHGEYPPGFEDIKKFHCEYCPEVRAYSFVEISDHNFKKPKTKQAVKSQGCPHNDNAIKC